MNIAAPGASARAHTNQARPVNFGQLNSAITRGDMAAAQTAFTAINESTAPAAMAAKAKGILEPIGAAIASGDVEAARKSLADFRSGPIAQPEVLPAPKPALAVEPIADVIAEPSEVITSTEQILAMLNGTGSTVNTLA